MDREKKKRIEVIETLSNVIDVVSNKLKSTAPSKVIGGRKLVSVSIGEWS